jgi:hypothetical protein
VYRTATQSIAYADAMTATPVAVTDTQVTGLEREFGRKGVLELTYLIALENMRGRTNSALDITDQGFTSGDACLFPKPCGVGDFPGRTREDAHCRHDRLGRRDADPAQRRGARASGVKGTFLPLDAR